jgi:hypothetical protein
MGAPLTVLLSDRTDILSVAVGENTIYRTSVTTPVVSPVVETLGNDCVTTGGVTSRGVVGVVVGGVIVGVAGVVGVGVGAGAFVGAVRGKDTVSI